MGEIGVENSMNDQSNLTFPVKIKQFKTLNSTNETAKQWLSEGVKPPFWIVSDEQTAGRGRQGRDWVSLKGNLFTSTGQQITANGGALSTLSLVTGVAVYEAIKKTSKTPLDLTLKWPNDILLDGAKLGGILIENVSAPNAEISNVIIGVGVNIRSNPVVEGRDTTCLDNHGAKLTRDILLNSFIEELDLWLKRWDNGQNFKEIRTAWLERAAPLGAPLSVKVGQERLKGKFAGLDQNGALKLELQDKSIKLITGGEVI